MLVYDQVIKRITMFVKQIEDLEYNETPEAVKMGLQLYGHFAEAVEISGASNVWEEKVKNSLSKIGVKRPEPVKIKSSEALNSMPLPAGMTASLGHQ